jgi:carboxyl-terminal processing protease
MIRRICVLSVCLLLFAALIRQPGIIDSPEPGVFVPQALAEENDNRRRSYELVEVFSDVLDEIDRNYVHPVDRAELVEAAIHGMLKKLGDRNSRFIIAEPEIKDLERKLHAKYDGVGIQLDSVGGTPTVVSPILGSSAYLEGVQPGDQIMSVDGQSIEGLGLRDLVRRMRSKPGEEIEITFMDAQTHSSRTVKLKNDPYETETVFGVSRGPNDVWNFMYEDADRQKIGYIRLTSFNRGCVTPLTEAAEQLIANGVRGLILDLRFNGGGYLPETFNVARLFLPKGSAIVRIEGRSPLRGSYSADQDGLLSTIPMAVLVNGGSGSGSEIVASCLQDGRPNTVVVGQRTFGKGTVQSLIKLNDGRSRLKLTTAVYHRPSGKNIDRYTKGARESDEWGVKPDEGYQIALKADETKMLQNYLRYRQAAQNRRQQTVGTTSNELPRTSKADETLIATATNKIETPKNAIASPVPANAVPANLVPANADPGLPADTGQPIEKPQVPVQAFVDRQLEKAIEYLNTNRSDGTSANGAAENGASSNGALSGETSSDLAPATDDR